MQPTLFHPYIFHAFIPTHALRHRRLAFRNTYGQSIDSVQCTFPFHGQVDRQHELITLLALHLLTMFKVFPSLTLKSCSNSLFSCLPLRNKPGVTLYVLCGFTIRVPRNFSSNRGFSAYVSLTKSSR